MAFLGFTQYSFGVSGFWAFRKQKPPASLHTLVTKFSYSSGSGLLDRLPSMSCRVASEQERTSKVCAASQS